MAISSELMQKLLPLLRPLMENESQCRGYLLKIILAKWCEQDPVDGYLGGNILNLLLLLGVDLTGENFSNIPVSNADLQNAELYDVDFSNSKFYESTFSETLSCIHSITFSPVQKRSR